MDLVMFLLKETYIWPDYMADNGYTPNRRDIKVDCPGVKEERIQRIVEEIGYWRNANAIHKWFVDNVQDGVDDCQKSWVSRDQLVELLALVMAVLEDRSKAQELLPTQSGFFFGSTGYDEWYFKDLEHTKTICEEALKGNILADFFYSAPW